MRQNGTVAKRGSDAGAVNVQTESIRISDADVAEGFNVDPVNA